MSWEGLFEGELSALAVQGWLMGLGYNRAAPAQVLTALFDVGRADFLMRRTELPEGVMDAAAVHPLKKVWGSAVDSCRLTEEQWERLLTARGRPAQLVELAEEQRAARGRPPGVRGVEQPPSPEARPPATAEELAALVADVPEIDSRDHTRALWWVAALFDDPEAMRLLAASSKTWVRRSVARAPHLPRDVAELLGHDEDRTVRLFLTESCEDAPAETLLEVWSWWQGSLSFPDRPRGHPNFPRDGLLRFAEDPRPRMRELALDDPESTPELVERFARDPAVEVRLRAAGDPRLSPATAVRLLEDEEESVRRRARMNPALPVEVLVAQLRGPQSARAAVENPAIPVEVMTQMVMNMIIPRT
ncbi:hypothetical protein ACFYNO_28485 [Kitasatospora sp. NPDC006697]|uniref:hypothetical protein n=1 Tax=Kitasatospora sp. NPDC006697 TaxID=3364020 RepID=UPI0036820E0C